MGEGQRASRRDARGQDATSRDGANDLSGESFQGLALRFRGRTGLTQGELGTRLGMHPHSIQGWESGANYPGPHSLQLLTGAYLDAGGFIAGQEAIEATALWAAAVRQAPRFRTPFDDSWFADLLARHVARGVGIVKPGRLPRQDWGEAPESVGFHGRADELETLERWILTDRCRLVAIVGLGGIGKTTLAARLAEALAPEFERVYWRSLRNAPPAAEWLAGVIGFLSDHRIPPPQGEAARIDLLLELARERRCLLVLDNLEAVLQPNEDQARYREGCAGYGVLLDRLGAGRHQTCLLLTSREAPLELGLLEGAQGGVRTLELAGLGVEAARAVLQHAGLSGDDATWAELVERYGGNGLALKIASESIRHFFGGDVASFLKEAQATFGGIRGLLEEHLVRLSDLERKALRWLAVERESVSFPELAADLGSGEGGAATLEAVGALRRRSLLVGRRAREQALSLQSVVQEYVTERLVEDVAREIATGQPVLLLSQALIKATAKDHVRRSQERLIAAPVLEHLIARYGSEPEVERRLTELLGVLRARSPGEQGYGPGNLINLLRLLHGDLRRADLSRLAIRQAYLAQVEVQDASLAGAHLTESVLAEAFDYPMPVALSADGAYLAAGTAGGEVHVWRVSDRAPILSAPGQTDVVMSVALTGDGRLLASGGLDGTVKLWDAASGGLLATLPGHSGGVWGVALSGDGRLLSSGGQDGVVRLWDVATGQLLATLAGQTGGVMAVALSGDGRLVVSGGQDGTLRLWETANGQLLATLEGHRGGVFAVAVSGDGRLLASGGADGTPRLWAVPGGEWLTTLAGHADQVWGVALSADGRLVASGSLDGTVKVWESDGGRLVTTLCGHTGVVMGVALSGDGRLVASAGHDGTVRLWDVMSGRVLTTLQGRADQVYAAALAADGRLLASGGGDGAVRLWAPATGQLLATLLGHTGAVWGVSLSGDGQLVASGGNDGMVRLWRPVAAGSCSPCRGIAGRSGAWRSVQINSWWPAAEGMASHGYGSHPPGNSSQA